MGRWYRVALICGSVPLLVGVSIFVLWLITRWKWLMLAGMFTVYGGVVLFCLGSIALICSCWAEFPSPDVSRKRFLFSMLGCAALLLSNFPLAVGIAATVVAVETRYTVIIHNTSEQPLERIRVFGGGCDCSFGTIPPGATESRSFWIHCDGHLELSAVSGIRTHSQIIEGYVTNGLGGRTVVTIRPDETISVTNDVAGRPGS